MTTYTIKPESALTLCIDTESADHVYTLDEIIVDAENFEINLFDYIAEHLDVHQDNPMDEDELLENYYYDAIAGAMEDSILEAIHLRLAPCTEAEFVREYLKYADITI